MARWVKPCFGTLWSKKTELQNKVSLFKRYRKTRKREEMEERGKKNRNRVKKELR
jgi:hypothetical protein